MMVSLRGAAGLILVVLACTAACGGGAGAGGGMDTAALDAADAADDAGADVPVTASPDAAEVLTDVAADAAPDVRADAALDVPPDVAVDVAPDLVTDVSPDVPGDVGYPAPYAIEALTSARINSTGDVNVRNVEVDVDWGAGPFERVTMTVELTSTCFPFESWQTNPPPAGQNWPADCDAFDRNFEMSLDEPQADGDPPGLELVRAITPFGGPMTVEADLTDIANGLPGAHRFRVHISTWSDGSGQVTGSAGGWTVSARFDVVPGPAPRRVLAVIPLVRGSHGAMAAPREAPFTAPDGTTAARLEYRVTGHGGGEVTENCIGPSDEFCWRTHELYADGAPVAEELPWRNDCQTRCTIAHYGPAAGGFDYCVENPCGAVGSVRANRANWCPGTVTDPFVYEWAELATPGEHTFGYRILDVGPGGSWVVSATYFAFGD